MRRLINPFVWQWIQKLLHLTPGKCHLQCEINLPFKLSKEEICANESIYHVMICNYIVVKLLMYLVMHTCGLWLNAGACLHAPSSCSVPIVFDVYRRFLHAAMAWFPTGIINVSSNLIEPLLSPQSRRTVNTAERSCRAGLRQKIPFDVKQTVQSSNYVIKCQLSVGSEHENLINLTPQWHHTTSARTDLYHTGLTVKFTVPV